MNDPQAASTISPFRLTIVASIVVLCMLGAIGFILLSSGPGGNPERAVPLFSFLAPTIVSLLALARVEQNAQQNAVNHAQNVVSLQTGLTRLSSQIDGVATIAASAAQAGASAAQATAAAHTMQEQAQHGTDNPA